MKFLPFFSLKKVWNEQKKLKTAEKSVLTSFQVHTATESWSKYTTGMKFAAQISPLLNFIVVGLFRKSCQRHPGLRTDARRRTGKTKGQTRGHCQPRPEVNTPGPLQPLHKIQTPQLICQISFTNRLHTTQSWITRHIFHSTVGFQIQSGNCRVRSCPVVECSVFKPWFEYWFKKRTFSVRYSSHGLNSGQKWTEESCIWMEGHSNSRRLKFWYANDFGFWVFFWIPTVFAL